MNITLTTQLPPEFVESLSVDAFQALRKWLEANAPANVYDLFWSYGSLKEYLRQVENNAPPSAFVNFGIVETAVATIKAISSLGGEFTDADGQEHISAHYDKNRAVIDAAGALEGDRAQQTRPGVRCPAQRMPD